MDEQTREQLVAKLAEIRKLVDEARLLSGMPSIETSMRFCEMYVKWAQFLLGEGDRFEIEVGA